MKKMVDLRRTKLEIKRTNEPVSLSDGEYPYGLRLMLDSDSLGKLGIKELPKVGDEYHLMAVARVVNTSQNASEKASSSRMELQVCYLSLEHEEEEKSEKKDSEGAENAEMYGKKNDMRIN